ncbi:3-hydroxyacyl-CoA dehydrogenase NAD-binding domain-containing protein [Acinetobacter baumannii]|uniref:3-hydroxyacyl-CoA dehydrogenase NAD-binding domain-containing protein n=1 Tax=Acinetobacter baumannii TaxID=470 RepID=UPI0029570DE8|nr:3-hydroxyacyl-CoA dehydrogenase NAD-binding domain-containing protein [Acinetobacter baumannii]MDV7609574.1 3-hydroxyacyl-CoA dehydrogenase NAD-binding domain-containing protein [Acinetobacter baumannii]MDV7611365.1 3-hydroxyacyl-CoA dehydrogenase NAD-binding domain-containing protein [Acinetobacter baumannii]MDV7615570.1 3-hydroxyacyl-CoA dehydrogenase NAD-binding domain-containing protein [Acinetobacter baumannii]
MSTLKFLIDAQGIAQIRIDLPDRPINIFTPEFITDLAAAVEQVIADDNIKGAVITSDKSVFIAGADLKRLLDQYDVQQSATDASHFFDRENALFRRIETAAKPFVALMNGHALGGGFELALACHQRLLLNHSKIRVGLPEVTVGLLPAGGGTQRLPRLIGIEKAIPLLLEGQLLNPEQALALGVVDQLVTAENMLEHANAWILQHPSPVQPWDVKGFKIPGGVGALASHAGHSFNANLAKIRKKTQDNYPAPLAILSAVYEGTILPFDTSLQIEAKYFGQLFTNPVARNLIRTQFVNKGRADKLVRRPKDIIPLHVKRIGIIGAGMMGIGIAHVASKANIEVILIDHQQETAELGKTRIAHALAKDIVRYGGKQENVDALLARIHPTTSYAELSDCDLVVEAVFEDRAVKAQVFKNIEQYLKPEAILASNTSTLPIGSLANACQYPNRVIGIHFFSPVERMPLVEVIVAPQTTDITLAHALDFIAQLRKTPIVVNDSPGFFTSRIFCSYIDEGMAMLAEGISPALIENASRMASFATAPLAVTDEVSLDLQKRVLDQAIADQLPPERLRRHAKAVITCMNQQQRLGRKTGAGFYDYPAGQPKYLSPDLQMYFPLKAEQPDLQDVLDRLLYIQALESARCVEEKVITDAIDADLGAVFGLGFPTWTGGPLSFIDTIGISTFIERCQQLEKYGERFKPSAWMMQRAAQKETFY